MVSTSKIQRICKNQKNRKTYQLRDIVASVNLILLKDNNRSVTKRTIQEDIKNL